MPGDIETARPFYGIEGRAVMLTFRTNAFLVLVGLLIFTLGYVSVGIRWHTYRARASLYAQQEVEHTFEAARFARAARDRGYSPDSTARSNEYRKFAELHERAALENMRLRKFYENCW
jgi:hypothetical protein